MFFWDPLEPQPHDPDVKALLRIAAVCNTPIACNRATADFLISSPLLDGVYECVVPSYDDDDHDSPGRRRHRGRERLAPRIGRGIDEGRTPNGSS